MVRMAENALHTLEARIREQVAGFVAGAPMREDAGFLFGSATKVLTTTLVLQQVERAGD